MAGFDPSTSPGIFPTAITMAKIYVDQYAISLAATLRSNSSQEHSRPPIFSVDEIDLAASYNFASGGDVNIVFGLSALIQAPPNKIIDPAELKGVFDYKEKEKTWTLYGSIDNLCAANFYQFFAPDIQMAAASLLDNIAVKEFNVKYVYTSRQASSFTIDATLGIGRLDFALDYENSGDAWGWKFWATVKFDSQKTQSSTFRSILINVTMNTSDYEIGVSLVPDKTSQQIVLTIWVIFGDLRIQYIQSAPSGKSASKTDPPSVKRVFLTSIRALPKIDVPVLDKITQPFDEALAMWIQPKQGSDGLTLEEVGSVNAIITKEPFNQKTLPYKSIKKEPAATNTVLRNGVHLMLVLKDDRGNTNVALDYVLGDTKNNGTDVLTGEDDFPADNGEAGSAAYSKSYGGLSVRNLGLKYANTTLSIKVDASVRFGPIDFSLIGFAIHLEFSDGGEFSLFNLPAPTFSLDGLEAGYDRPPTTVAGMFMRVSTEQLKMYQGALAASFQPWAFSAAGCYGQIEGLDAYKTFFVYARLQGPLMTFEFATISCVTAGFGYNNSMLFPTVADITSYPLISVSDPPSDAQTAIKKLTDTK